MNVKLKNLIKTVTPAFILYGKHMQLFILKYSAKRRLKKRSLLRFEIDIVSHCNLNCCSCTHFSPLAEEKFMDTAVFERDFSRLSELTDGKVDFIDLMGGEPLLHPQISKIAEIARRYFHTGDINIVTNGILLTEMNDDFWRSCRENNIIICVSEYLIELNTAKIKQIAESNRVELIFRGKINDKTDKIFNSMWKKVPLDVEGKQDGRSNYRKCPSANTCISLNNGRLSTCCLPFVIGFFNQQFGQTIPVTERDYIDIFKVKDVDEIFDFLTSPIPICAYCNVTEAKYGVTWGASKKEMGEWV